MKYTEKEQQMINNFYDLYFLALAEEKEIGTKKEFELLVGINKPLLDDLVKGIKEKFSPNKEMGEEFSNYATMILVERFGANKIVACIDTIQYLDGLGV